MEETITNFEKALKSIDRLEAEKIISKKFKKSDSLSIIDKIIVPVLEKIGEEWEKGDITLAQVYLSAGICENIIDNVLPNNSYPLQKQPRMAIVVLEDCHVLGKKIVSSIMKAAGYEFIDYGFGVSVEDVAKRAIEDNIGILLISVLMLPSALRVKRLREILDASNKNVKIVVGGAPFRLDEELWKEVGADAMGKKAYDALTIIKDNFNNSSI